MHLEINFDASNEVPLDVILTFKIQSEDSSKKWYQRSVSCSQVNDRVDYIISGLNFRLDIVELVFYTKPRFSGRAGIRFPKRIFSGRKEETHVVFYPMTVLDPYRNEMIINLNQSNLDLSKISVFGSGKQCVSPQIIYNKRKSLPWKKYFSKRNHV